MHSLFGSRILVYERINGIACCDGHAPHFAALRLCVNLLFRRICQPSRYDIIGNPLDILPFPETSNQGGTRLRPYSKQLRLYIK